MEKSISLYCNEGTSDKVYHIYLKQEGEGYTVTCQWGKRNTKLNTTPKTDGPVDLKKATKIFDQILNTQLGKRYQFLNGSEGQVVAQADTKQHSGFIPQQLVRTDDISKFISNPKFLAQEKHDDRRFSVIKKDDQLTGINKLGIVVPVPPRLAEELLNMEGDFHLDGELVGEKLICFDLLSVGVFDLKNSEYRQRLESLYGLKGGYSSLQYVAVTETAFTTEEKQALFDRLKAEGREGIVFKNIFAPYSPGKPASGGDQFKFRFEETASFVVAGINDKRSVQIALFDKGKQKNAGNVTIPPNKDVPPVGAIVEVRYLYAYRKTGVVSQPVYLHERDDVEAAECVVDQLKFKAA